MGCDISVAGAVNDSLGKYGGAPLLGLYDDTTDFVSIHNCVHTHDIHEDFDTAFVHDFPCKFLCSFRVNHCQ